MPVIHCNTGLCLELNEGLTKWAVNLTEPGMQQQLLRDLDTGNCSKDGQQMTKRRSEPD